MGHRADVVERVLALGHRRLDESLQLLTEDATWLPCPGRPVVRGHDEIRAFVAAELQRLGSEVPDMVPGMLFERESVVLVLGQIQIPHKARARPYVEMQPIAWVYEFEGDLIARVSVFGSWEKARAAAGVPAGTPPTRALRGGLWHPAVAVRRPPLLRPWLAPAPGV